MSKHAIGLVSPRDRKVAIVDFDDADTCGIASHLTRYPATEFVTDPTAKELEDRLAIAEDRACTLDFALMLFDPAIATKLKQRIAGELDVLLQVENNENYALDVILGHPLPPQADIAGGTDAAEGFPKVHELLHKISTSQDRVRFVRNAWLAIRSHDLIERIGAETVRGRLINSGVVRRLVLECETRADLEGVGGRLAIAANEAGCDARIVQALISEYRQSLPHVWANRDRSRRNAPKTLPKPRSEKT